MKQLFLFILLVSALNAKAQNFCWAQGFVANGYGIPDGFRATIAQMAFDRNDNKYFIGGFNGILDVDAGPNTYSFTSTGPGDMFLLKEDAAGNFVWAKHFAGLPGSNFVHGSAIDLDASGNIYIAGDIAGSFDMDPGPDDYLFSSDGSVGFILKLDSSGNFVWAKKHEIDTNLNTGSGISGMKIIGDAVYAAASFLGTVDLDPGPGIFNVTCTPGIGRDIALIRMDTAGDFIWAKTIGGPGIDDVSSLAADSAANLYITGGFQTTVDFDPGPGVDALFAQYNSLYFEAYDVFVAKYDSAGNYLWAKAAGSSRADHAWQVALDTHGNVLTTGTFSDKVDFDPGPATYDLGRSGETNVFTLKLDNNGNFVWARKFGGRAIATDDSCNVYTAGRNNLQKLDSSGNLVLGGSWGGNDVTSIGLDTKDSIYIAGSYSGYNDFDPGSGKFMLPNVSLNTTAGYILKLNQIPILKPTGINEASFKKEISVYPNPSSGIVTFSSPISIQRIELRDIAGKVVYMNEPKQAKTVIDLSGKAGAVYIYEVDCGTSKQSGKLVTY